MTFSNHYPTSLQELTFVVTGGAGFIGSHLVDYLVQHQAKKIIVVDSLLTGSADNLSHLSHEKRVEWIQADIRDPKTMMLACEGADYVFHQAALGSVPRSIELPQDTFEHNVTAFHHVLMACKYHKIKRLVFASSSSVYGDSKILPKEETQRGNLMSPYAASKMANEIYAQTFSTAYNMEIIGLRYFNVFGPRQNPKGVYAAVIPQFMEKIALGLALEIHGDGSQTRDFTYIDNVIQANIKAAFHPLQSNFLALNIGTSQRTSLLQLIHDLETSIGKSAIINHVANRLGDIQDSIADIHLAKKEIGYDPQYNFEAGLEVYSKWFLQHQIIQKL